MFERTAAVLKVFVLSSLCAPFFALLFLLKTYLEIAYCRKSLRSRNVTPGIAVQISEKFGQVKRAISVFKTVKEAQDRLKALVLTDLKRPKPNLQNYQILKKCVQTLET